MTPSLAMRPTMVAMRTPRAAAATNRAVSLRVRAAPARRMNLGAGARGRRSLTTPRASTEETGLTKSQVRCVAIHPHVGTLVPDGTCPPKPLSVSGGWVALVLTVRTGPISQRPINRLNRPACEYQPSM
jgi:hypothetical protein